MTVTYIYIYVGLRTFDGSAELIDDVPHLADGVRIISVLLLSTQSPASAAGSHHHDRRRS